MFMYTDSHRKFFLAHQLRFELSLNTAHNRHSRSSHLVVSFSSKILVHCLHIIMTTTPPSSLSPCQMRNTVRRPPSSFLMNESRGEYHQDSLIHALSMGLRRSSDDALSKSPRQSSDIGSRLSTIPFPLQDFNDMRQDRCRPSSTQQQRRTEMTSILDAALRISNEVTLDLQSWSSTATSIEENDESNTSSQ